ncbi:PH domain-containing protein [Rufibacter radiotolerans]|nr:PH domain-containing protein [Rufibacter radiotolerans]
MGLFDALMGNASEISTENVAKEFAPILIEGERIEKAFRLIRDMFVFTNKRLILVDKQGLTGSKVDFMTIPYSSIKKFSKESAGILDLDAELKIWLTGDDVPIKKEFGKGDRINEVYQLLSTHILNKG